MGSVPEATLTVGALARRCEELPTQSERKPANVHQLPQVRPALKDEGTCRNDES